MSGGIERTAEIALEKLGAAGMFPSFEDVFDAYMLAFPSMDSIAWEHQLTIQGIPESRINNHPLLDQRLRELIRGLAGNFYKTTIIGHHLADGMQPYFSPLDDLHLVREDIFEQNIYRYKTPELWGGFIAKEGKKKSGDRVVLKEQYTAVIDGVTPSKKTKQDSIWGEYPDATAAEWVKQAFETAIQTFDGNPDIYSLVSRMRALLIERTKAACQQHAIEKPDIQLRAGGIFTSSKHGKTKVYVFGDGHWVGIRRDGSLYVARQKHQEGIDLNTFQAIDRMFGALGQVISDPLLLREYLSVTYDLKGSNDALRLFSLTTHEDEFNTVISYDNLYAAEYDVPDDVVAILSSSDGFVEQCEELPFWAILPSLTSSLIDGNGVSYSPIQTTFDAIRGIYGIHSTRLERQHGIVDDDAAFCAQKVGNTDYKDFYTALHIAFHHAQKIVIEKLEDRSIIPGAREHNEKVLHEYKDHITQFLVEKYTMPTDVAQVYADVIMLYQSQTYLSLVLLRSQI